MTRTVCTACQGLPHAQKKHCHECKGVGYIESLDRLPGCTRYPPVCPIEYEPAVGGWYCTHCHDSGPMG